MILATKADMYAQYRRGRFGNRLRTWATLEDYRASGYSLPVVLRYAGAGGGAWCAYNVPPEDVDATVAQWVSEGANPKLITLNESADDSQLILQGEVMRSPSHYSLRYSTVPKPMRQALAECQHHAEGLTALMLMRSAMDAASWDELQDLLDDFDGAVIEFSVWGHDVGDAPRRNTVFWEVRHY